MTGILSLTLAFVHYGTCDYLSTEFVFTGALLHTRVLHYDAEPNLL